MPPAVGAPASSQHGAASGNVPVPAGAVQADSPADESALQPYDAKFARYTTPENYEQWAHTPPKIGPESKPGEYEAWTGAHGTTTDALETIPTAALETAAGISGASAIGGALDIHAAMAAGMKDLIPALTKGTLAVGAWAEANPRAAKALYESAKAAIWYLGAKHLATSAGKVINAGQ
jgi:hypothetical protein